MKLSLGFSPCPNDTFIFDALVNHKMDAGGLELDVFLEDVQTLNEWAMQGKLDISKISYGVLPLVSADYDLLNSGGALGKGVGPLLIAKSPVPLAEVNQKTIAIPGRHTTANLLFSLAFPDAGNKQYKLFSNIEQSVLEGSAELGVIIHENRFTYQQKGLFKVMDLGAYWESQTNSPIPLGGIVMRKKFGPGLQHEVNALIRKSVEYAFARYPLITEYVQEHAREMEEAVMRQHIDLYVNDFSIDLGEAGKAAVNTLLSVYEKMNAASYQQSTR